MRAHVLAADAFHAAGNGDAADVFDLVAALDWLVAERAAVINLSFSGPANAIMATAIARVTAAGIVVAAPRGRHRQVDGTSFAAPFVTAAAAMGLPAAASASDIANLLGSSARDLGAPGRDPVFGWGLVQFAPQPQC